MLNIDVYSLALTKLLHVRSLIHLDRDSVKI